MSRSRDYVFEPCHRWADRCPSVWGLRRLHHIVTKQSRPTHAGAPVAECRRAYADGVVEARSRRARRPRSTRPASAAAAAGPEPRRTQAQLWRPPAPCHEGSWPRSGRQSRGRQPHRSRPGAASITAFLSSCSLEHEDAVRTRELTEAQSHHPRVRRHATILALPTPSVPPALKRGSRRGQQRTQLPPGGGSITPILTCERAD